MRRPLAVFCGIAVCLSFEAFAQTDDDEQYIGLGARVRPAYQGADSNRGDAIPYLRLYGEHLFARTTQGILEGGWRTGPFGGVIFGAQLAYEEGRESGESSFLKEHSVEDIDPSASIGLHAESDWKIGPVPLNALLRYRHDVESDNGAQADLRVTAGILEWGRVRAGLFGQFTWGDGKSTGNYFGLTPQQSASTGLPAYSTGSGLRFTEAGLIGVIDIAEHWVVLWGVNVHQLQGDARDSPIVQDRTNWYANVGMAYRF